MSVFVFFSPCCLIRLPDFCYLETIVGHCFVDVLTSAPSVREKTVSVVSLRTSVLALEVRYYSLIYFRSRLLKLCIIIVFGFTGSSSQHSGFLSSCGSQSLGVQGHVVS